MNTLKASRCSKLLFKYKKSKDVLLRNSIYERSKNDIIKYLKVSSRKPLTDLELLSMSWDVFLICIEKHSPDEDYNLLLINAAHTVCNRERAQEKKKKKHERNVGAGKYPEKDNSESVIIRDSLIAMKDFRNSLPKNYKSVFDDCLASFGEDTRSHQSRIAIAKIPAHRYYEAKKLMKWFTQYLFGRRADTK